MELSNISLTANWLAQALLFSSTLVYTKKNSPVRFIVFLLQVALAYHEYQTSKTWTSSGFWNSLIGGRAFGVVLKFVAMLFFDGIERADLYSANGSARSFLKALSLYSSTRGIATKWETKNVPAFPAYYNKKSDPECGRFLLRQAAFLAWEYLLLDLFYFFDGRQSTDKLQRLYGNGAEFVVPATQEQLGARVTMSLIGWFVVARTTLDDIYRFVSLVAVATGMTPPEEWRPLFGSMWDAYTLRNFWGKFWHQMLRWPLTSISNFLTRRVLRLPKPSLLERYTNIFLVFTLSGILHVISHLSGYNAWGVGTMMFFQSFTFGIMIEDCVQELWRRFSGTNKTAKAKGTTPLWQKVVGAIWVVVFLSITSPWFFYQQALTPKKERWIIPFPITEKVGVPGTSVILGIFAVIIMLFFKPEI